MTLPTVVSREEWLVARRALLAEEKAATKARDALNARRRELSMVRVEKEYVFDAPEGKRTLTDLFYGRRQLIVCHVMFDPTWDAACKGCSMMIDSLAGPWHLHARNTTLVAISRAPLAKLEAYRERMGWTVPWVSSYGSDFNYDFGATIDKDIAPALHNFEPVENDDKGEVTGISVFLREGDDLFHTYTTQARGTEVLLGTYAQLDLTPLGRQEDWEHPKGRSDGPFMSWLRRHDEY